MSVDDYSQLYASAGQKYGVDPALLMAQGQQESGGNPNIVSDAGAVGLAQLMPATAKSLGVTDPTDPAQAIDAQARLMAQNLQKYGDTKTALMAYHGGDNQSNWGPKTQAYPAQVLKHLLAGTQMAQNTVSDPLADALKNYKDDSSEQSASKVATTNIQTSDPLADALKNYKNDSVQSAQESAAASSSPKMGVTEDLALTAPSSLVKGIGAIPQWLGMGINAAANTIGEGYYGYNRLVNGAPKDNTLYNRLTNINPIVTGNTPLDALYQAGANMGTTGNNVSANPLTDSVLHDPQTMPGRFENALIQAAVAGKGAGGVGNIPEVGLPAALAGGGGAQAASELFHGSPSAQLLGGGVGYKVGKEFTPNPLQSDVATEVVNAKNEFNIDTPTAAISKNNWAEKLAAPADAKNVESQANKAIVDMIGANDNGEGHTVLNRKSYLSAEENNSTAYDNAFKGIGNVNINQHIVPIMKAAENIGTPTFNDILEDIQSKQNPDGTLPASAIKELIKVGKNGKASVLQQLASNTTDRPSAIAAGTIIDHLETALQDTATPEQYAELKNIDTRYKTMKTMEPIAKQVGAGNQATVPAVQNALNTSFPSITKNPVAPVRFSNYLNTINPGAKSSGLPGINGEPITQNALLPTAENVAAIASGHPWLAASPIVQKVLGIAVGNAASKYTNMNWYKNRLLENAQ